MCNDPFNMKSFLHLILVDTTGTFFPAMHDHCFVTVFWLCCAVFPVVTGASELLSEQQQAELARHPVWLKLLHVDASGKQSEIQSEEFFLAPDGQSDPKAELLATVDAYFQPWSDNPDDHPRCRFPARYFWLSQYIPFPGYSSRLPQCKRLERWALFEEEKSVSVLLVSGYLGNPASTFGHALLKLNRQAYADQVDLLNVAINYGALVPPHEMIWLYVLRGLLGGYQAGFSDKYFYSHDLVYSRTEFRDMWEYELALSEFDRTLLGFHLWELIGKKFTYYFLKENCAFRLAELLELVIPEPLIDRRKGWYLPVEMFHRLVEIDAERRRTGKPALLHAVRFIPSSQRKLYHQFARLSTAEKNAAEAVIKNGPTSIPEQLAPIEPRRQLEVLDAVLAYHTYRLVAEETQTDTERQSIKDQILLAQLRLPPQLEAIPPVSPVPAPTEGNRPMLLSLGAAHTSAANAYVTLRWSPFTQEATGRNSLEGDELTVLDTSVGVGASRPAVFLDHFDLIRIRKMKTTVLSVDEDNPWSWQLRIGMLRTARDDTPRYDGLFRFGVGRAWKFNSSFAVYAVSDAEAHTLAPAVRLRPHVGVIVGYGVLKSWWYGGAESANYEGDFDPVWGGQIQWNLSKQAALFFHVSQESALKTGFEFRWYR